MAESLPGLDRHWLPDDLQDWTVHGTVCWNRYPGLRWNLGSALACLCPFASWQAELAEFEMTIERPPLLVVLQCGFQRDCSDRHLCSLVLQLSRGLDTPGLCTAVRLCAALRTVLLSSGTHACTHTQKSPIRCDTQPKSVPVMIQPVTLSLTVRLAIPPVATQRSNGVYVAAASGYLARLTHMKASVGKEGLVCTKRVVLSTVFQECTRSSRTSTRA